MVVSPFYQLLLNHFPQLHLKLQEIEILENLSTKDSYLVGRCVYHSMHSTNKNATFLVKNTKLRPDFIFMELKHFRIALLRKHFTAPTTDAHSISLWSRHVCITSTCPHSHYWYFPSEYILYDKQDLLGSCIFAGSMFAEYIPICTAMLVRGLLTVAIGWWPFIIMYEDFNGRFFEPKPVSTWGHFFGKNILCSSPPSSDYGHLYYWADCVAGILKIHATYHSSTGRMQ